MSATEVCEAFASWKLPKLSSVPAGIAAGLITTGGVAKLSVVGIGMRSHSGVAARLFDCLGKAGINIQLISTSEIKIAVIIDGKDAGRAAQLIHKEFGLSRFVARTLEAADEE